MTNSKTISILVGILILYIGIGWYGNFDYVKKDIDINQHEFQLSHDEADILLIGPIDKTRTYYYEIADVTVYSRTIIPFKYKKLDTKVDKIYYSKR